MDSSPSITPEQTQHLLGIKKEIAEHYPNFEANAVRAWGEIIEELDKVTREIKRNGTDYIPQVNFADLDNLPASKIEEIKRKGSVVIKDVVPDEEVIEWRELLRDFLKKNPNVEGVPSENPQFFQLYWTKSQVKARSHPNMLKAQAWLNNLYHTGPGATLSGVDLNTPLSYADRFRFRQPGFAWGFHPPHVDGGSIERWEDPVFRTCFEDILKGDWRKHDPFDLTGRLNARHSLYQRPNQASIFRTFQGWLALSETAPTEGTLKVFPDVLLSNAYTILRPFFIPKVLVTSPEMMKAENWAFDISQPGFPGILPRDGGWYGPRPTNELHPHLKLAETMISVPKVYPGDTVFWHCDGVHAVEEEHTGKEDSSVMYIPAVPMTPMNQAYIERQRESFLNGLRPPDFPQGPGEANWVGTGVAGDITSEAGRKAMGLPIAAH